MSYDTIEAGVATVIEKHADFSSDNVVRGNAFPIKTGVARSIRLLYGGHRREEIGIQAIKNTWTTFIDLYVPWRGSLSLLETTFQSEFQKVIDTIEAWPNLDAVTGVVGSALINASSPEPLETKKGAYRAQRLILETDEAIVVTRSE